MLSHIPSCLESPFFFTPEGQVLKGRPLQSYITTIAATNAVTASTLTILSPRFFAKKISNFAAKMQNFAS